ncbi:hypothetical protein AZE42_13768 [Rhizopogon vesiculosus]|uniref:Uncharacterized protein n=1 Tax=Rhizopogon vesiculosus TaxID=180088 RepID=A0A1J8R3M4_9AGAM|nr:hypothetical protein AZE42_13768 [Rhizopogon vesiculosus]
MIRFQGPASRISTPEPFRSSSPRRGVIVLQSRRTGNDLPKQILRKVKTHRLNGIPSIDTTLAPQ